MSDGPTDFESGYFFESQKGISDCRAALGLDQGPSRSSRVGSDATSVSGGGGIAAFIGIILFWLILGALWLGWQILKLIFQMMAAIFSRR